MSAITVILNLFKRQDHLEEQYEAVMNQTIKPEQVIIWNNGCDDEIILSKFRSRENVLLFDCSQNLGVWPRFFISLLVKTKYVCFFDDDIIPGRKWFENCVDTMTKIKRGILGAVGIIYKHGTEYNHEIRVGWVNPNEKIVQADTICHSWFLPSKYLNVFLNNLPNTSEYKVYGEDMHLSFTNQLYNNIKTFVPPHPANDLELWASDPVKGIQYGTDENAISLNIYYTTFNIPFKRICELGFETIVNKNHKLRDYDGSINYFFDKIKNKKSFALIRFTDREYKIMKNEFPIKFYDGWNFNGNSILSEHLLKILKGNYANIFYGIPTNCESCTVFNYLNGEIMNSNKTFVNIFCNTNYNKFVHFVENYEMNSVLISAYKPSNNKIGKINILEHLPLDLNLVEKWDKEYKSYFQNVAVLCKKYFKTLFLVSGGPVAKVLIYKMYKANPDNIYLDVGSTIDPYTKNCKTRVYQCPDIFKSTHVCKF